MTRCRNIKIRAQASVHRRPRTATSKRDTQDNFGFSQQNSTTLKTKESPISTCKDRYSIDTICYVLQQADRGFIASRGRRKSRYAPPRLRGNTSGGRLMPAAHHLEAPLIFIFTWVLIPVCIKNQVVHLFSCALRVIWRKLCSITVICSCVSSLHIVEIA